MSEWEEGQDRRKAKRDWWAISISLLSLFVAISTFVAGSLLQKDDLRVVIGESPFIGVNEKGELHLAGTQQLTFINSGNRAAAVTYVGARAWNISGVKVPRTTCNSSEKDIDFPDFPVPVESKQFVIKPSEFEVVSLKLTDDIPAWTKRKDGHLYYGVPTNFRIKDGDTFFVCLTLNVVTPDSITSKWSRPAYKIIIGGGSWGQTRTDPLFDRDKPIEVLFQTNFHTAFRLVPIGSTDRSALKKN